MSRTLRIPRLFLLLLGQACTPPHKNDPIDSGSDDDTSDSGDTGSDVDTSLEDTRGDGLFSAMGWHLHPELRSLAYLTWEQEREAEGWIVYDFEGSAPLTTPRRHFDVGPQSQILLGIPYAAEFTLRLVMFDGTKEVRSDPHTLSTGPLPPGFPSPRLVTDVSALQEPTGNYLLGSVNAEPGGWTAGDYWKWILDRRGRVVWALLTPNHAWSIYLRVSLDGRAILWDEATYWSDWDLGEASTVHRARIDLGEEQVHATPGLHHVFTELPDGSLVWGAAARPDGNLDEVLMERSPSGETREIWECNDYLRSLGASEHCQSNSLYWHEATDTFLYSFYTTNSVLEIDHATGEVLRSFGHLPGCYDFVPPESEFWWQHGVTWTEAGTMLLSTRTTRKGGETSAREYLVDDANSALVERWSFGEGEGVYASTAGEAHRLPGGNTLHNYGSAGVLREVTPEGEVVWELDWDAEKLLGRSVFLEDLYALAP